MYLLIGKVSNCGDRGPIPDLLVARGIVRLSTSLRPKKHALSKPRKVSPLVVTTMKRKSMESKYAKLGARTTGGTLLARD